MEESLYLKLGNDIVKLMEMNIPGTFVYHFVKGSTGAVDPSQGNHLLKAYGKLKRQPSHEVIRSYAGYPLHIRGHIVGVLCCYSSNELHLLSTHIDALKTGVSMIENILTSSNEYASSYE